SEEVMDPARRRVRVLTDIRAAEMVKERNCTLHDIYTAALDADVCPYRYLRNRETFSMKDQRMLFRSRVAVVGAGGLGGHVILLLARAGIGELVVVDPDRFDETNLNRQALSSMAALGRPKAGEAARQVGEVNPAVRMVPHEVRMTAANAEALIKDSAVVVDALDNVPDRFVLEKAARSLKIPLVHGALAGLEGQLMTVFPEDHGLSQLYGKEAVQGDRSTSPEALLGVPALMPALLGTLQATEVVKIILNRGRLFRRKMVHLDLETGEMNAFTLDGSI
ncbi:MAG: HesA/MoeB/ThiF family protein, partial [Thermodesulfobacteriota bacterium]